MYVCMYHRILKVVVCSLFKNYLFLFFFSKNELILKYTEGKPLVRNQQVFNSYLYFLISYDH